MPSSIPKKTEVKKGKNYRTQLPSSSFLCASLSLSPLLFLSSSSGTNTKPCLCFSSHSKNLHVLVLIKNTPISLLLSPRPKTMSSNLQPFYFLIIIFFFFPSCTLSQAPSPAADACNGIFLSYTFHHRTRIHPYLSDPSLQPYSFRSTATIFQLRSPGAQVLKPLDWIQAPGNRCLGQSGRFVWWVVPAGQCGKCDLLFWISQHRSEDGDREGRGLGSVSDGDRISGDPVRRFAARCSDACEYQSCPWWVKLPFPCSGTYCSVFVWLLV